MNAIVINEVAGCKKCRHADEHGNSCKFGLLFPVFVMMTGEKCPNFETKPNL